MALSLGRLFVEIGAQFRAFSEAMKKVEDRVVEVGENLTRAGTQLSVGVSAPILAFGGAALKAAIDFESSFAAVQKNVDGTTEQLEQMAMGVRQLSTVLPASTAEINAVASAAGQLGIRTENVLEFTEAMIMVGETTNLSAEQAATSLAQFANITKLPQDELDRLASTVLLLGKSSATTESKIVELGLRLAGAGAQIRLTDAEILGFATALSSVGIEAEAGGTALSRVFVEVQKAVSEGGMKLENFAEIAGKTTADFAKEFKRDAAGAILAFIEGLDKVKREGGDVFQVLEGLEFENVRVRDALLRAAGAGDLLRKSLGDARGEWATGSTLAETFGKRLATVAAQLDVTKNRFTEVLVTIGQALLPGFQVLATTASGLITIFQFLADAFSALPGPLRMIVFFQGLLVAGIGPLLLLLGGLVKLFVTLKTAVASLIPVLTALQRNPLVAIATILITVVTLLGAFATGAVRAANASSGLARESGEAAARVRELNRELEAIGSKRGELVAQIDATRKRIAELREELSGKFFSSRTARDELNSLIASLRSLEAELGKLDEASAGAEAESAILRRNAALDNLASQYRATGDEAAYLNGVERAQKDLLTDLVRLIPETDQRLQDAKIDYENAARAAAFFNEKQTQTQGTLRGSKDIWKAYQAQVKQLNLEFQAFGGVQQRLEGEYKSAEDALRSYIAAGAAAGKTFGELMDDPRFQELLERWKQLKTTLEGVNMAAEQTQSAFGRWFQALGPSLDDLSERFTNFADGFTNAWGNAVGDALVRQESFSAAFRSLWVDLLAQTVSGLAAMLGQWVLHYTLLAGLEALGVATHATAESAKTAATGQNVAAQFAIWVAGSVKKLALWAYEGAVWVANLAAQLATTAATAVADLAIWAATTSGKVALWGLELAAWIAKNVTQAAVSAATAAKEIATWLIVHAEKLALWAIELARIITYFATYIYMAIVAAWSSLGPFGFAIGLALAAGVVAGVLAAVGAFAEGGIVTNPMLGLVGEAGPEAIIPLDRLEGFGGFGGDREMTVVLVMDGRETARVVFPYIPGEVRRKLGSAL